MADLLKQAVLRLHLFRVMGKRFMIDPVTLCCVEADEVAADILTTAGAFLKDTATASDSELFEYLLGSCNEACLREFVSDLAVLREKGKILAEEEKPQSPPPDGTLNHIVLNVSHTCNLRCRYCFADHGTHGGTPSLMSEETAKRAVDFLVEHLGGDYVSVGFFGGEPLMNLPIVRSTVECCKEQAAILGKQYNFNITTNATLLTADIIEFLESNNFSIIVSLDGPAHLHDLMRIHPDGRGTHDAVMRSLQTLRETRLPPRITLTSTYTSEIPTLVERFDYLRDLWTKGYAGLFSVEPADLPDGSMLSFTPEILESVKREYEEMAAIYCRSLNEGIRIPFFHFEQVMENLFISPRRHHACSAGREDVTVGPDGTIYACQKEGPTRIGSLDDGIDAALRRQWWDNTIHDRAPCPTCWARYVCRGECRFNAIEYSGDASMPHWMGCELRQHWIKLCLWIVSELNKGARAMLMKPLGRPEIQWPRAEALTATGGRTR